MPWICSPDVTGVLGRDDGIPWVAAAHFQRQFVGAGDLGHGHAHFTLLLAPAGTTAQVGDGQHLVGELHTIGSLGSQC